MLKFSTCIGPVTAVIHFLNSIEKRNLMEERMPLHGVGPVFAALSFCYGIVMLIIGRYFHPVFQVELVQHWLLTIIGILFLVIGVPFFLISVMTVVRAYNANELVTGGIFRCCRHPLYASWVVFIVPGIALLLKSWTLLTTPLFMAVILHLLVKKEEAYLERAFGSSYTAYKKRVPCILPVGQWTSDSH